MSTEQLNFFPSLDFPDRRTVMLWEIAKQLGLSERKVFNDVDSGLLRVCDFKGKDASRRCIRATIEQYRAYVMRSLTGPIDVQTEFLRGLPAPVRREIVRVLQQSLQPNHG